MSLVLMAIVLWVMTILALYSIGGLMVVFWLVAFFLGRKE